MSEVRGFPALDGDGMGMGQYLQYTSVHSICNNKKTILYELGGNGGGRNGKIIQQSASFANWF